MLLGIKLSNLSREQKNLKDKRKKINQICRVPYLQHSAKLLLCRVPGGGTRQRLDAISPPNGRRTAGARAGHVRRLCRVPPGQHSAKVTVCRVPFVADSRHSAKLGHAVWQMFAECSWHGTWQTTSLPSARVLALGKGRDTRQIWVFR